MSVPYRGELEGQGAIGLLLVRVLETLQDELHTSPYRIGNARVYSGTGTPQSRVKGNVGDLYLRTDGSTSTTLYVKETGNGTLTGWTAK